MPGSMAKEHVAEWPVTVVKTHHVALAFRFEPCDQGLRGGQGERISAPALADTHAAAILPVEGLHAQQNGVGNGHGRVTLGRVPWQRFRDPMCRILRPFRASPVSRFRPLSCVDTIDGGFYGLAFVARGADPWDFSDRRRRPACARR